MFLVDKILGSGNFSACLTLLAGLSRRTMRIRSRIRTTEPRTASAMIRLGTGEEDPELGGDGERRGEERVGEITSI